MAPRLSHWVNGVSRRHAPGWQLDNFSLRYARNIPLDELRQAHEEAKQRLIESIFAGGANWRPQ